MSTADDKRENMASHPMEDTHGKRNDVFTGGGGGGKVKEIMERILYHSNNHHHHKDDTYAIDDNNKIVQLLDTLRQQIILEATTILGQRTTAINNNNNTTVGMTAVEEATGTQTQTETTSTTRALKSQQQEPLLDEQPLSIDWDPYDVFLMIKSHLPLWIGTCCCCSTRNNNSSQNFNSKDNDHGTHQEEGDHSSKQYKYIEELYGIENEEIKRKRIIGTTISKAICTDADEEDINQSRVNHLLVSVLKVIKAVVDTTHALTEQQQQQQRWIDEENEKVDEYHNGRTDDVNSAGGTSKQETVTYRDITQEKMLSSSSTLSFGLRKKKKYVASIIPRTFSIMVMDFLTSFVSKTTLSLCVNKVDIKIDSFTWEQMIQIQICIVNTIFLLESAIPIDCEDQTYDFHRYKAPDGSDTTNDIIPAFPIVGVQNSIDTLLRVWFKWILDNKTTTASDNDGNDTMWMMTIKDVIFTCSRLFQLHYTPCSTEVGPFILHTLFALCYQHCHFHENHHKNQKHLSGKSRDLLASSLLLIFILIKNRIVPFHDHLFVVDTTTRLCELHEQIETIVNIYSCSDNVADGCLPAKTGGTPTHPMTSQSKAYPIFQLGEHSSRTEWDSLLVTIQQTLHSLIHMPAPKTTTTKNGTGTDLLDNTNDDKIRVAFTVLEVLSQLVQKAINETVRWIDCLHTTNNGIESLSSLEASNDSAPVILSTKAPLHQSRNRLASLAWGTFCFYVFEFSTTSSLSLYLRLHWNDIMEISQQILSTCTRLLTHLFDHDSRSNNDRLYNEFSSYFVLAYKCTVSITAVFGSESLFTDDGGDNVSSQDWEFLFNLFERILNTASSMNDNQSFLQLECPSSLICFEDFMSTVRCLLNERVGQLLIKASDIDTTPFVEFKILKHVCLLVLQRSGSFILCQDALENLEWYAIKCWCKYGFSPYRYDNWEGTASEILDTIFRKTSTNEFIHSTNIRLKSLKELFTNTFDIPRESETHIDINELLESNEVSPFNFKNVLVYQNVQYSTDGSYDYLSGPMLPVLNNILLDTCMKETYDTVDYRIVPEAHMCISDFWTSASDNMKGNFMESDDTYCLELYVIQLIGKFIRYSAVSIFEKNELLALLTSVSLNKRIQLHATSTGFYTCLRELGHSFCTRLGAIREIGKCLCYAFENLRDGYELCPTIIECICCIVDESNGQECYGKDLTIETSIQIGISAWSIALLSGLGVNQHQQIEYQYKERDFKCLADITEFYIRCIKVGSFSFLSRKGKVVRYSVTPSATTVEGPTESRVLNFNRILMTIVASLHQTQDFSSLHDPLIIGMRRASFFMMWDLAISGIFLPVVNEAFTQVFSSRIKEEVNLQLVALGYAIMCASSNFMADTDDSRSQGIESDLPTILDLFLDLYATSFSSFSISEAKAASRLVSAVVVTLKSVHVHRLLTTLENFVHREQQMLLLTNQSLSIQRILTFAEVLFACLTRDFESELSKKFILYSFRLTLAAVLNPENKHELYLHQIGIRCLPKLIIRMDGSMLQEGLVAVQEIMKERLNSLDRVYTKCVGVMLSEFINRQNRAIKTGNVLHRWPHYGESSRLLELSSELDDITSFHEALSDGNDKWNTMRSAWLYDDNKLLTVRLGSQESRRCGWIEIILRTIGGRDRRLLRIANRVTVDYQYISCSRASSPECKPTDLITPIMVSDAVPSALNVSSRFDSIFRAERNSNGVKSRILTNNLESESFHRSGDYGEVKSAEDVAVVGEDKSCTFEAWLESKIGSTNPSVETIKKEATTLLDSCTNSWQDGLGANELVTSHTLQRTRLLKWGSELDRAIGRLDRTSLNFHKIALLYDANAGTHKAHQNDGQTGSSSYQSYSNMLLNGGACSLAFLQFSLQLGTILPVRKMTNFSAGLDTSMYQTDGEYALFWWDTSDNNHESFLLSSSSSSIDSMVVFHNVNFMPDDVLNRKRHIGNDNVIIMYVENDTCYRESTSSVEVTTNSEAFAAYSRVVNNSTQRQKNDNSSVILKNQEQQQLPSLLGGAFGFVTILVVPTLCGQYCTITVRIRSDVTRFMRKVLSECFTPHTVTNDEDVLVVVVDVTIVPAYVRNLAIQADIACQAALDQTCRTNMSSNSNDDDQIVIDSPSHIYTERYRLIRQVSGKN